MTAGQFWDEGPWLAAAYREAMEYQAQRKSWKYGYKAFIFLTLYPRHWATLSGGKAQNR